MRLVNVSFNMQYYIFPPQHECLNNQCSILLLEVGDAGSTEGHFNAPDLIQVLLPIHNFHLKWRNLKYIFYIFKDL